MSQYFLFDQGSATVVTFFLVWNHIKPVVKS